MENAKEYDMVVSIFNSNTAKNYLVNVRCSENTETLYANLEYLFNGFCSPLEVKMIQKIIEPFENLEKRLSALSDLGFYVSNMMMYEIFEED